MNVQFNSIKSANQNIKIVFNIVKSIPKKNSSKSFSYDKESIFNYSTYISDSQIEVSLCLALNHPVNFRKLLLVHL